MATKSNKGHWNGSVTDRSQTKTPSGHWVKRNADNGQFMDVKSDGKPFKSVAKEPDGRKK